MKPHHSSLSTFFTLPCALVLLFLAGSSLAENKLLATEVSNAGGWREFHIAVDADHYAWCGPDTKLVVHAKKDGIKLIDVATWKVQETPKGSNPVCSQDGKFIYFRDVQPDSTKFVQIATDTWTTRKFDTPVYGPIQVSENGRYVFFTSSGTGQKSRDGLYYLDVPSGKVFTIHRQRLPTFKSENYVSPGNKYFIAPPGWRGKPIRLTGGEKLIPVSLASSGELFDKNYSTDDWVWMSDDHKLMTLNWRTQKAFLVRLYESATGKYQTSSISLEGVEYIGATLRTGLGDKVYIYADQSDRPGAILFQVDLDNGTSGPFLKSVSSVDFSDSGVTFFRRHHGVKVGQHDTELNQDPSERFVSFYVIDKKGRETRIRSYPFGSGSFAYSNAHISRNGQAIAFSRHTADFSNDNRLVILLSK